MATTKRLKDAEVLLKRCKDELFHEIENIASEYGYQDRTIYRIESLIQDIDAWLASTS